MNRELMQDSQGQDDLMSGQKNNQKTDQKNEQTIQQRDLDRELLRIHEARIGVLTAVVNRLSLWVVVFGLLLILALGWLTYQQHLTRAAVETATVRMERVEKHVWELKHALRLRFSQERSAAADNRDAETETVLP